MYSQKLKTLRGKAFSSQILLGTANEENLQATNTYDVLTGAKCALN